MTCSGTRRLGQVPSKSVSLRVDRGCVQQGTRPDCQDAALIEAGARRMRRVDVQGREARDVVVPLEVRGPRDTAPRATPGSRGHQELR